MAEGDTGDRTYDVAIIGAGPAGLTAGIYAARYKLSAIVIGAEAGGTITMAHKLHNWPGFSGSGMELMQKFQEHLKSFDVPQVMDSVRDVAKEHDVFILTTEKNRYKARTVILAMGTKRRKLGVPGEEELSGKGVSYCATCDAFFFKDKTVGVVGGSDSAAVAAQILSHHAKKVYIIYRKDHLRAEPARVEELESDPKVEFIYNANVTGIQGKDAIEKVKLDTGQELELDGLFIEIGGVPLTEIAKDLGIDLEKNQRIKVGPDMSTNIPGVYAAGDITTGSNEFNQVVTAAAEGSLAALAAFNHLKSRKIKYQE